MKDFKENLISLFRKEFGASDETCRKIEDCEDFSDIGDLFKSCKELKDALGVTDLNDEIYDLEEEVDDLKKEVKELKSEVECLEFDLVEKTFKATTYWDFEKYELFLKHHGKFNSMEFEELMTKK